MSFKIPEAHALALKITAVISGILVLLAGITFLLLKGSISNDRLSIFQSQKSVVQSHPEILINLQNRQIFLVNPAEDRDGPMNGPNQFRKQQMKQPRNLIIAKNNSLLVIGTLAQSEVTINDIANIPLDTIERVDIGGSEYLVYAFNIDGGRAVLYEGVEFMENAESNYVTFFAGVIAIFSIFLYGVAYWIARMTLKPMEEAIEQTRAYNRYIAHELKTPLSVISSNLELAKVLKEQANNYIDSTIAETRGMQSVIDRLLFIAQKEYAIEKTSVALLPILKETLDLVQAAYPRSDIVIETIGCDQAKIQADPALFGILLKNVLENAMKYALPGELVIEFRKKTLKIKNRTESIGEERLQGVFDPFVSHGGKGSGIGLSIVKRIASIHNWNVAMRETGGWMTFTLLFK